MVEDRGRGTSAGQQASKKANSGPVPASYLEPGARLEAKDPVNDQWFPVKVTDEDKEEKAVRILFGKVSSCLRLHQALSQLFGHMYHMESSFSLVYTI